MVRLNHRSAIAERQELDCIYRNPQGEPTIRRTETGYAHMCDGRWHSGLHCTQGLSEGDGRLRTDPYSYLFPYNLAGIKNADPDEAIWIVESEEAAEFLIRRGQTATTCVNGFQHWDKATCAFFDDKYTEILAEDFYQGCRVASMLASARVVTANASPLPEGGLLPWLEQSEDWLVDLIDCSNTKGINFWVLLRVKG